MKCDCGLPTSRYFRLSQQLFFFDLDRKNTDRYNRLAEFEYSDGDENPASVY